MGRTTGRDAVSFRVELCGFPPAPGKSRPFARCAVLFILAAAAAACIAGCAVGEGRQEKPTIQSRSYEERMALEFYERSVDEIGRGEYSPALSDVIRAGTLARSKGLKARIQSHRTNIVNHIRVSIDIAERATLKYTLTYNREEIFYPIENVQVLFSFVEGKGAVTASSTTDGNGTASGTIDKITSMRRVIVIEAVPAFNIEGETVRFEELKRNYVLPRNRAVEDPEQGTFLDVIGDILEDILYY